MAKTLFDKAQLEARLTKTTIRRIFDDDNDGSADTDPVDGLIRDASSKVLSYLGPDYDISTLDPQQTPDLIRIALDVAQAMAAQRHPEYVRVDGFKLMNQAMADLKLLRQGFTSLGENDPGDPLERAVAVASGPPRDGNDCW